MKLNKSLKIHMTLKLASKLQKKKERGQNIPENKEETFKEWLSQVKAQVDKDEA